MPVPTTGYYVKFATAHECLSTPEFNAEYWQEMTAEEKYDRAIAFGLKEEAALILFRGYEKYLVEHYKTTKTDKIPRELLFDWFLAKNYSKLYFDEFKFLTVLHDDKTDTYHQIQDKDFDRIHTEFRTEFPWCNYQESACFKKIVAYSQTRTIDTKKQYFKAIQPTERSVQSLIIELVSLLQIDSSEKEIAKKYLKVWFTGLIERSLNPGSKFDLVLVFNGKQGVGKSRFFERIFPDDTYIMSNSRDLDSKDKLVNLSTSSIVIWDEIGSFSGKYMIESIKQFLTLCFDAYRPVYGRQTISRGRRCVFAATTNDPDVLEDLSGSRRFMVLTVGTKQTAIDQAEIDKLIPQLLAAVKTDYKAGLLQPYLDKKGIVQQTTNNLNYNKENPFKNLISEWIISGGEIKNCFTTIEVAERCLGIPGATLHKTQTNGIGKVLRNIGYKLVLKKVEGVGKYVWYKKK